MICTRDVIEAVSLGLVLAPVFVRGIAIMPDRKDNITSFSGGLPFGRTMFSFFVIYARKIQNNHSVRKHAVQG